MLFSMHVKTVNLKEFQKEAEKFIRTLAPAGNGATVVGLYGELGAGKTTFVQAAAKALGIAECVTSPTFLILKSYKLSAKSYKLLCHVDAYRLKNSGELRGLQFEKLLADPGNLIFVEWANRIADMLPTDHRKLFLEFVSGDVRSITVG